MTTQKETPAIRTEGMRDVLFNALDGLNAGRTTAQEAQAICKICAQIINSDRAVRVASRRAGFGSWYEDAAVRDMTMLAALAWAVERRCRLYSAFAKGFE